MPFLPKRDAISKSRFKKISYPSEKFIKKSGCFIFYCYFHTRYSYSLIATRGQNFPIPDNTEASNYEPTHYNKSIYSITIYRKNSHLKQILSCTEKLEWV